MKQVVIILSLLALTACDSRYDTMGAAAESLKKKGRARIDSLDAVIKDLERGIYKDTLDYKNSDCSYWIERSYDKISDEYKISSGRILPGKKILDGNRYVKSNTRLEIYISKSKKGVKFIAYVVGKNCVREEDKLIILFRDGSKMAMVNETKFNCDGALAYFFDGQYGNKSRLKTLMSKDVETIRVDLEDSYFDVDFSPDEATQLKTVLTCIANTGLKDSAAFSWLKKDSTPSQSPQ